MRTGDCVWCKRPLTAQAGTRCFKEGDGTKRCSLLPCNSCIRGICFVGQGEEPVCLWSLGVQGV